MSKIVLGQSGSHSVKLDLDVLLSTRMLLTADSGGGKTFALKRIVEQASAKMQIMIVDPEGEFSPLREHFNFVLVGKGGETPADVRSAAMVAQTLLKLGASAICDIYEMKPSARHEWVSLFLNGLIEAPKQHRHPCLVIVDEAHMFCPERGKGESVATEAMRDLCTRGRKRLLCPLFATQRLATLNKDASSMLLNRMIGPTFEDLNRKRAAEILSVTKEDQHEFNKQIQLLEPGNFFVLGRAISRERVLMHVDGIESAHGQEALKYELAPPPPPDAIKDLLPKLADLPKAAEEKARTEAEFRREIRDLNQKLREASKAAGKAQPTPGVITRNDPRAIQLAVTSATKPLLKQIEQFQRQAKAAIDGFAKAAAPLNAIANAPALKLDQPALGELPKDYLRNVGRPDLSSEITFRKAPPPARSIVQGNGDVSSSQQRILNALAEFDSIGIHQLNKTMLAAWCQCSPTSGGYFNNLGKLRGLGLIDYPGQAVVSITEEGRKKAVPSDAPLTTDEMFSRTRSILSASQFAILEALRQAYPESLPKSELAEKVGASPTSGGYFNNLGKLRSSGLIDYPEQGKARVEDWMFLEGAA